LGIVLHPKYLQSRHCEQWRCLPLVLGQAQLCDVVMNKSTIGFKGGCNPVPLAYLVRDGAMIVQTGDLETEKGRFK
jgi:hypothetical protein